MRICGEQNLKKKLICTDRNYAKGWSCMINCLAGGNWNTTDEKKKTVAQNDK